METETAFIVPRGDPGLAPLRLDMELVHYAESRIPEVAFVNAFKAPELLAVFNKAYLDLTKIVASLEVEMGAAELQANMRRSEVVLDVAPEVLSKRGLKTSEDLRTAVVDSDVKYIEYTRRLQTITAYRELMRGKMKSLEWAYNSVKKILGDRPQLGNNPYQVHDGDQSTQVGENETKRGFGKTRY